MEQGLALTSISVPLGTIVPLGFYLIATVYIVFSAIFYYHWNTYSSNAKVTGLTYVVYLVTTLPVMSVLLYNAFNI